MQHFDSPHIYYLEPTDFDVNARLLKPNVSPITHRPVFQGVSIVLIQGNFCGYCTRFKPAFLQVANELTPSGIDFATIQTDGDEQFKPADLEHIMGFKMQGVPMIVKFVRGKAVGTFNGERTASAFKRWVLS